PTLRSSDLFWAVLESRAKQPRCGRATWTDRAPGAPDSLQGKSRSAQRRKSYRHTQAIRAQETSQQRKSARDSKPLRQWDVLGRNSREVWNRSGDRAPRRAGRNLARQTAAQWVKLD